MALVPLVENLQVSTLFTSACVRWCSAALKARQSCLQSSQYVWIISKGCHPVLLHAELHCHGTCMSAICFDVPGYEVVKLLGSGICVIHDMVELQGKGNSSS